MSDVRRYFVLGWFKVMTCDHMSGSDVVTCDYNAHTFKTGEKKPTALSGFVG